MERGAANLYTPLPGELFKLQTHFLLTPVWCGYHPTSQQRTGRPGVAAVTQPEKTGLVTRIPCVCPWSRMTREGESIFSRLPCV